MTAYWKPNWATGEVIHCDEHGCCISEHTVASGNSVSKWECFKMLKILPDRLPDSHENARESVTPAEVVSSWGTWWGSDLLLASRSPPTHENICSLWSFRHCRGMVCISVWVSRRAGICKIRQTVSHPVVLQSVIICNVWQLVWECSGNLSEPGRSRGAQLMTYKIVRFKYPNIFKPVRTIRTGLTLEQAQEHCRRPDTKGGEGESAWFDGYEREGNWCLTSAAIPTSIVKRQG